MSSQSAYSSSLVYWPGQQVIGSDGNVYAATKVVPPSTPPPNSGFWSVVDVPSAGGIPSTDGVPDGYILGTVGGKLAWVPTTIMTAQIGGNLSDATGAYTLSPESGFPVDLTGEVWDDNHTYAQGNISISFPPQTVAEGGVLIPAADSNFYMDVAFLADGISTPNALFQCGMIVTIANDAGTQVLQIYATNALAQGLVDQNDLQCDLTNGSSGDPIAGTDLVFDAETGEVTSTAGGVFTVGVIGFCGWQAP